MLAVLPRRFGKYGLTIHPDKPDWCRSARRRARGSHRRRAVSERSTFWGSRTSGRGPGTGTGFSSGRRRPVGSPGRSGRSPNGAGSTATTRSPSNTRCSARSFAGTQRITGSRAIARHCPVFTTQCSTSGGSGSCGDGGHGTLRRVGSSSSWNATPCRTCTRSTRCAGAQRSDKLEEPNALIATFGSAGASGGKPPEATQSLNPLNPKPLSPLNPGPPPPSEGEQAHGTDAKQGEARRLRHGDRCGDRASRGFGRSSPARWSGR